MTKRWKFRGPARSGQVLILALLGMTVLVALIFYVYNVGDQVNRRTTLQNVADATAISGAGWIARSMNVMAMNNCEQSRLATLVPIMDALPLACEMSGNELTEWEKALADQLARGVPQTTGDHLQNGIESLRGRMAAQRDILGLIFLRYADHKFSQAEKGLEGKGTGRKKLAQYSLTLRPPRLKAPRKLPGKSPRKLPRKSGF